MKSKVFDIINLNSNLNQKDKKHVMDIAIKIENMIPKKSRNNFYRNLIDLELVIEDEKNELKEKNTSHYSPKKNKITISYEDMKSLSEYSNRFENADEVFACGFNQTLAHEMLHMASSYYDAEKDIVHNGLHKAPYLLKENALDGGSYVALTEGITEYLSCKVINYKMEPGYKDQYKITEQLIGICGEDVILESYFEAKGPEKIKNRLYEIVPNIDKIDELFGNIETGMQFEKYGYSEEAKLKHEKVAEVLQEFLEINKNKCFNKDER